MMRDLAKRYAAPVPRYTSYPTTPHFSTGIGHLHTIAWLSGLPERANLSLYVHIPFCASLCWYCGCNTNVANRYATVSRYLDALMSEIANVGGIVPPEHQVSHVHWGGGSPSHLAPADIARLAEGIRTSFRVRDDAQFAVEIDPRELDPERARAFNEAGVNRASIGVQDFDPAVQAAINRRQSHETTRHAVAMLRDQGISSINIDLVYGLPYQTRASVARTLDQVVALEPDRIAIFGYAHLPDRIRHQRLIDEKTLAGPADRLGQANRLARKLCELGYARVGLDHFARPEDELAKGSVRRNFQGYTTDTADALIGFGASAISRFPDGYAQNAPGVADYEQRIDEVGIATSKGKVLTDDDKMRAFAIERLMCDFEFSRASLSERFGGAAAGLIAEADSLLEADRDGLIERTSDGFRVTALGRHFVRSICACFDAYLGQGAARHSIGV